MRRLMLSALTAALALTATAGQSPAGQITLEGPDALRAEYQAVAVLVNHTSPPRSAAFSAASTDHRSSAALAAGSDHDEADLASANFASAGFADSRFDRDLSTAALVNSNYHAGLACIEWCLAALPILGAFLIGYDVRRRTLANRREISDFARHASLRASIATATPQCIVALGLTLPCSEDQVKSAYRQLVKKTHPDRGGNARLFIHLQGQFEDALRLVARKPCRARVAA